MAAAAVELLGFFLGLLGMIGTLTATVLPYWEISSHLGANIITAVVNMKGLWMECVYQSTGAFQCETYNTILGLPTDLQAARAMMVLSVLFSVLACAVSNLGMQCTVCMGGSSAKTRVAGAGGGLFLTAGLLALIPVSWKTHEVVQTFYTLNVPDSLKYEMGDCLYVGMASSLLSMLGGGLLSISCCDEIDGPGGRRGTRRPGGGYPYPQGIAVGTGGGGIRGGASHSMPYRGPPAATAVAKGNTLSHTSTSSHSTHVAAQGSQKAPRQHPAAGYDVTGYV
ncbi:claudin-2 [Clupea harengus]|uniref:Claudin-2 n=1 Tax=Clupea harengus TaxID=7950 RepID=A0A6P8FF99_CLUHA|nr:claudin-2 [Clupea harengus]XP_042564540.1 claudin-2 [Clupea harengus]